MHNTKPDHPIISIYPELILYVEPDVLYSKPPSYGTIYLKISKKSVILAPSIKQLMNYLFVDISNLK